jgi:hypothetical protein
MNTRLASAILMSLTIALPATAQGQRKAVGMQLLARVDYKPTRTGLRYDSVTKRFVPFTIDGTIDADAASGNFVVSWNREDGGRERVVWEPPQKISIMLAADVTFDQASGLYTYVYTITNRPESRQALGTLFIEGDPTVGRIRIADGWLTMGIGESLQRRLGVTGGWSWSRPEEDKHVQPGQTVTQQISSKSPPAVVRCFVRGQNTVIASSEEVPEELAEGIANANWTLPSGFTIGPAPSATPATATGDMSQLLTFLGEAERQGWLGSSATASRARAALAGVGAAVDQRDRVKTATQINAVLSDIDRAPYADMLSEARALLRYRLPLLRDKAQRGG